MPSLWTRFTNALLPTTNPQTSAPNRETSTTNRFNSEVKAHVTPDLPLNRQATTADLKKYSEQTTDPKKVAASLQPVFNEAFKEAHKRGHREFELKNVPEDRRAVLKHQGRVTDAAALANLFRWPEMERLEVRDRDRIAREAERVAHEKAVEAFAARGGES